MSLSSLLQDLKAREHAYQPSAATRETISNRTLTALIAPTAVGKSTLIRRALELGDERFSESYSVVTRARRPSDPPEYKTRDEGYTIERVAAMIDAQELTHYTIHPSGNIYGSLPESFPAPYNLLPCVPSILSVVQRVGFSAVHTISIVTSAHDWAERLPERRADASYIARLNEALESLTWSIEHADNLFFVVNSSGKLDDAAWRILDIAQGKPASPHAADGMRLAEDMLALARRELAHIASSRNLLL